MHCRNCSYPLWNLAARRCPECGDAFRPSEFRFEPHGVRFCCPRCNQPYFGTSEDGLPEPRSFECVRCHAAIDVDEMVLRPGLGVEDRQRQKDYMPWFDGTLGRWKAWFLTIGKSISDPRSLIRAAPEDSSFSRAWRFGSVTSFLFLLVGLVLPYALYFGAFMPFVMMGAGAGAGFGGTAIVWWLAGMAAALVGGLVFCAASVLLWAGLAHLFLRVTGGAAAGFRRTMHAVGYSAAAGVFTAIPCCGPNVGWIAWLVSGILMLMEGQKVGGVRATFAMLMFPILSFAISAVAYVGLMYAMMSGFNTVAMMPPAGMATNVGQVQAAVMTHAQTVDPGGPSHAIELVEGSTWLGWSLVAPNTATYAEDVPVGGTTLEDFSSLTPSARRTAVQAAIDALPEDVVAHRLGDFVFTHHGADLLAAPPGLWVVLMIPDPDVNADPQPEDVIEIATAGGNVMTVARSALAEQTARQNEVRAGAGLPPLPDLTRVTHDAPARASDAPPEGQQTADEGAEDAEGAGGAEEPPG